jgi:ABC-type antimicrobial peptide transport system permease subunit
LNDIVDQAISPKRLMTLLLGSFSVLALVLAALGIYGVISYSVSQRTHEMGIRLAVGASTASVVNLVILEGMKMAAIGVAIGLVGSLAVTRLMRSLLFGIDATDPATFLANAAILGGVAFLACWLPARRAARVDPMVALRDS